jgi:hypothetical protein
MSTSLIPTVQITKTSAHGTETAETVVDPLFRQRVSATSALIRSNNNNGSLSSRQKATFSVEAAIELELEVDRQLNLAIGLK